MYPFKVHVQNQHMLQDMHMEIFIMLMLTLLFLLKVDITKSMQM